MIQLTLNALNDPTRRQIIKLLLRAPRSAGEISKKFDVSAPAISRHLAVLRDAELVEAKRDGKNVIYSLSLDPLEDLAAWIDDILSENM